jgi:SRSO17 transposase
MALSPSAGWAAEFDGWLAPFLSALSHPAQRRWAPPYLRGLLLPGERKSVEPMAARVAPGEVQQLHHFVSASPWAAGPLEAELVRAADRLVGGPGAVLVVDDTALVKQGAHSVGVQRQYCGELGKRANCQALVSLTPARGPARGEVPVCVGLRLFLPEGWAGDPERRRRAGVPAAVAGRPKWRIALDEVDRVRAAGARFGCVLGDAEYGKAAEFRHGLSERRLTWALGIGPTQKVFPADVTLAPRPLRATGRPARHPAPSAPSVEAAKLFAAMPRRAFRPLSWRRGTKGPLEARFAAVRVRVADGPVAARAQHLPGEAAWLVCEERAAGERKYHLTNHPADAPLRVLAATIKARWVCEQVHQQMKRELGLDHFEGRGWRGLHHHALLCQIAYAFLQHLRLGGKTRRPSQRRTTAGALAPRLATASPRRAARSLRPMSRVRPPTAAAPAAMNMAE